MDSLADVPDSSLDAVSLRAPFFLQRDWLRLIDALDLIPLLRGEAVLRHVLVHRGAELVAVCPLLIARGPGIPFTYSFTKAFFTGWPEELMRLDPESAGVIPWLARMAAAYRSLADRLGAATDGWVLAVSPLSYRGGIAVRPMAAEDQSAVRRAVLETLRSVGREEKLPHCLYTIPEEEVSLRCDAVEFGLEEIFLTYNNVVEVRGSDFEDTLARFPAKRRNKIRREIRRVEQSGVNFEWTRDVGAIAERLAHLYEAKYSRYGDEHFTHPPDFWRALGPALGARCEFLLARRRGEPVAFTTVFDDGRDLEVWRGGKTEGEPLLYFSATLYEPIRRAHALGRRRVWLGPNGFRAKRERGARPHGLWGYIGFPTARARALLLPYVRLFTRYTKRSQSFAAAEPSFLPSP